MQSAHIDASEVSIEVKECKVTLEGTVPERRMKHAIEDMAEACPGVVDVENRLRVQSASQRWGYGGSSEPTNAGTGSTTHGAGSSTGGTGTTSSTSPGGAGMSGKGAEGGSSGSSRDGGISAGMATQGTSSSSTTKR